MEDTPVKINNDIDVVETNTNQSFQSKEKDNGFQYLTERSKKLTTALYLVTNLIPQNDPLRLSLREHSIKLVSISGSFQNEYSFSDLSKQIGEICRKIAAMLEIAFFSGYVSEMNFSVLKSEFDIFASESSSHKNFQSIVNPESLKVNSDLVSSSFMNIPRIDKGQYRGLVKDRVVKSLKNEAVDNFQKNTADAKKTSRKEAILSIIKRRGVVNIKDISSVILDCSEKTIQRELLNLVSDGLLKKSGERRWSSYSLV